jgi:predicted ArsR family transcriptional regulator
MSVTNDWKKATDDEIIALLKDSAQGFATASELAEQLDMTRQGVDRRLRNLKEQGRVQQQLINPGAAIWMPVES